MVQNRFSNEFLSDLLDTAPISIGTLVKKNGHVQMKESSVREISDILGRELSGVIVLSTPIRKGRHKTEEAIKDLNEDVQKDIAIYSSKKLSLNDGLPLPVMAIGSILADGNERCYGMLLPEFIGPSAHNWPYLSTFSNISSFFYYSSDRFPVLRKNSVEDIIAQKVRSCRLYAGVTTKIFRNAETRGNDEMVVSLNFPLPFYFKYERALCYSYSALLHSQEKGSSEHPISVDGIGSSQLQDNLPVVLKLMEPAGGIVARSNIGIRRFMVPAYTKMHVKYSVLDPSGQGIYPFAQGF